MESRKSLKILGRLALGIGALSILSLAFLYWSTPRFKDIRNRYRSSDILILDRRGEILHEIRTDQKMRRLDWVTLERISPQFTRALIQGEDHRYYSHHGIDFLALGSSLSYGIKHGHFRGASTLSMQAAALLDDIVQPQKRGHRKTIFAKIKQALLGVLLDLKWQKNEILEAYANLVHFRGELHGISSAAYGIYNKSPMVLNKLESALLVALIRSPNSSVAQVSRRTYQLLESLGEPIQKSFVEEQVSVALGHSYNIRPLEQLAPHVARQLVSGSRRIGGQTLHSTLDKRLQSFAREVLMRNVLFHKEQNMTDGAALVIENATGNVLAYVGNIGKHSSAVFVDGVRALRQAGSTLKPFLYGRAMEKKLITPATILRDEQLEVSDVTGLYKPQNYDRHFRKFVTARAALASSLNIPAVRVLEMLGVDELVLTLEKFGIQKLKRDDYYGPSLALGSADISLWDLTNSYRTLANGGMYSEIHLSDSKHAPARQVLDPAIVFLIGDILSDRSSRSLTFGLENMLATRYWTAVKTGTSKDMRDNWTVGYSRNYTVGVWTGNFSGSAMWNVSGIHGAAPVWLEIMNYLHENSESPDPLPPQQVVKKTLYFSHSGQTLDEYFLSGTEPSASIQTVQNEIRPRITYPQTNTMIALDPDFGGAAERVFFQTIGTDKGMWLELNGLKIGDAKTFMPWKPKLGRFHLKLRADSGQTLDEITFDVRGNRTASR